MQPDAHRPCCTAYFVRILIREVEKMYFCASRDEAWQGLSSFARPILGKHWQAFPAQSLPPEKAGRERVKTSPPHHRKAGKGKNLHCFTLMVHGAALPNISRRKYESEILRELLQQRSSLHNPHILSRALRNLTHMVYLHWNVGQSRVRPYVRLSNDKSLADEQLFVLEQLTEEPGNQGI